MSKKTTTTLITILFFSVLVLDIYAVVTENKGLEMIFKPLIVTLLAILYLVSVEKPSFWYLSALFFCFWGDVLLIFDKYFIAGLVSFLIGHLLYIKLVSTYLKNSETAIIKYFNFSTPFIVFFLFIVYLIKDKLGDLLVPVLLYGVVISGFGTVALVNYIYKKTQLNLLLLFGAVIFIVSDSMIAINRFYLPHSFYRILVMSTYGIAQFFICKSIIGRSK